MASKGWTPPALTNGNTPSNAKAHSMTDTNPAPRVLVLQHADPEHPGLILEALRDVGAQVETIRTDLAQTTPTTLENYAGLIILGGPQSVYEEDKYPYLRAENNSPKRPSTTTFPCSASASAAR